MINYIRSKKIYNKIIKKKNLIQNKKKREENKTSKKHTYLNERRIKRKK